MVITTPGIVATAQTLASQAGAQVLARGGSAVDAAIAANAVLSVVEPMMNGPDGFPVTELIQWDWENTNSRLGDDARKLHLPNGAAPKVGEIFRNAPLGHALCLIAELGARAFYDGPVGEALLKTSAQLGGTLTAADLSEFDAEWVQPISTDYRGW
jgi:gamma-glutamyltranspeptidase